MSTQNIYLLRHGEIETGGSRRYIGQIDLPLHINGRLQAFRLRDHLSGVGFDRAYCSDLERSLTTARIICEKQETWPVVRQDLREISLGNWEGKSFSEIKSSQPEEFNKRGLDIVHYRPPGGESFAECAARAVSALGDILESNGQNILIVSHAGINRCIICHVLGIPLENLFKLGQDFGCVNVLNAEGVSLKLTTVNYTFWMFEKTMF